MMMILKTVLMLGLCFYADGDVKVRYHCHITQKYRGSPHWVYNINVKLNHKNYIVFHNLKQYDSYLIMQEVGKFNFKINVMSNGLGKDTSFNINNTINFIVGFQFLSSSLDKIQLKF